MARLFFSKANLNERGMTCWVKTLRTAESTGAQRSRQILYLLRRAWLGLALILGLFNWAQAQSIVAFPNNDEFADGYAAYHNISRPFLVSNERYIISEFTDRSVECSRSSSGRRVFNVLILKYDKNAPISESIDFNGIGQFIDPESVRECENIQDLSINIEFAGIRIRGMSKPSYLSDISLADYLAADKGSSERVADGNYHGVHNSRNAQLALQFRKERGKPSRFDIHPRNKWYRYTFFLELNETFNQGRQRVLESVKRYAVEVASYTEAMRLQDEREAKQTVVTASPGTQHSILGQSGGLGFQIELLGERRYQDGEMLYSDSSLSVYRRIDPAFPREFCEDNSMRLSVVHNVDADHQFTAKFLQRKALELREKLSPLCGARYFAFSHFVKGFDFLTFHLVHNGSTRESTRVVLYPHPILETSISRDYSDWGEDVDGWNLSADYTWDHGISDTYALDLTINRLPLTTRRALGKLNPVLIHEVESLAANWMSAEDLAKAKARRQQAIRTGGEILGALALIYYFSGEWSHCKDPNSSNRIGC
jgi:hypothetical protein